MYNLSAEDWKYISRMGFIEEGNERNLAAEGLYYGGEKLVFDQLKTDQYLPFNIDEVIEAGVNSLRTEMIKLQNAQQVADKIISALEEKKGYSLVRLGDGELIFLAHDYLLSSTEIINDPRFNFLSYAGVTLPDHTNRDSQTKDLLQASLIGIPQARFPTFQCLFNKIAHFHKWDLNKMNLASSNINYEINNYTTLYHDLLSNYRILLIGNRMVEGKNFFESLGYKSIVGTITVKGLSDVPTVLEKANNYKFDVALVAAGVPANLICINLAKINKIAIDFGHLIDLLIHGSSQITSLDKCSSKPDMSCKIGDYFFKRNDFETATKWYTYALESKEKLNISNDHSTWFPHMQLCLCYWNLGQSKKAFEHNEFAAQYLPNDPGILFNRKFFQENNIG